MSHFGGYCERDSSFYRNTRCREPRMIPEGCFICLPIITICVASAVGPILTGVIGLTSRVPGSFPGTSGWAELSRSRPAFRLISLRALIAIGTPFRTTAHLELGETPG